MYLRKYKTILKVPATQKNIFLNNIYSEAWNWQGKYKSRLNAENVQSPELISVKTCTSVLLMGVPKKCIADVSALSRVKKVKF